MIKKGIMKWDKLWHCTQNNVNTENWTTASYEESTWNKYVTSFTPVNKFATIGLKVGIFGTGPVAAQNSDYFVGFVSSPTENANPTATYQNIQAGFYCAGEILHKVENGFTRIGTIKEGDIVVSEYNNGKISLYVNYEKVYTLSGTYGTMYQAAAFHWNGQVYRFFEDAVAQSLCKIVNNHPCGELEFNGTSSYGLLPSNLLPTKADFTMETRFYPRSATTQMIFSDFYSNAPGTAKLCFYIQGNSLRIAIDANDGQGIFDIALNGSVNINSYNTFRMVRNGISVNYYVNGAATDIGEQSVRYFNNRGLTPYALGKRLFPYSELHYNGTISYIRVYDGQGNQTHGYEFDDFTQNTDWSSQLLDSVGILNGTCRNAYKIDYGEKRDIITHGAAVYSQKGGTKKQIWGIDATVANISKRAMCEYVPTLYLNDSWLSTSGYSQFDLKTTNVLPRADGMYFNGTNSEANLLSQHWLNYFNNKYWAMCLTFTPEENTYKLITHLWGPLGELQLVVDGAGLHIICKNYLRTVPIILFQKNNIVLSMAAGSLKVLINGVMYSHVIESPDFDVKMIIFGKYAWNMDSCYKGLINNLKLIPMPITDDQMKCLYNNGKPL